MNELKIGDRVRILTMDELEDIDWGTNDACDWEDGFELHCGKYTIVTTIDCDDTVMLAVNDTWWCCEWVEKDGGTQQVDDAFKRAMSVI